MERSKQTFINGKKDGDFEVTECTPWRATAMKCLFFTSDVLGAWQAEANWGYCLSWQGVTAIITLYFKHGEESFLFKMFTLCERLGAV